MSTVIDSKVVEMQFDNRQFEKNVAQSMRTLDNLNKQVQNTESAKALTDLASAADKVSFDKIAGSLEAINNRFSTLGIVGMTIISNLTTSAMRGLSQVASKISGMISVGGLNRASNIEKAKFSIEGLGVAWNDVSNAINYSVSKTAYGLDQAALAASTLVASGVSYTNDMSGTLEKMGYDASKAGETLTGMHVALKAISGVAAQTNSDFASIADIFSTVAGQGNLMTMQMRQLEGRGLNVAAKIGDVLGKTEAEVREMVRKGKIDFETFANSMFVLFADHASDANKTLTGVSANVRAAFAKIGADFYTPIIQNEGPLVHLLDTLQTKVNALKSTIIGTGNTTRIFADMVIVAINKINRLLDAVNPEDLGAKINGFATKAKDAFDTLFNNHTDKTLFDSFTESYKGNTKELVRLFDNLALASKDINGKEILPDISAIAKERITLLESVGEHMSAEQVKELESLKQFVSDGTKLTAKLKNSLKLDSYKDSLTTGWLTSDVWKKGFGDVPARIKELKELQAELKASGGKLSETDKNELDNLTKLTKAGFKAYATLPELYEKLEKPTVDVMVFDGLKNIFTAISKVIMPISNAWHSMFNPDYVGIIYSIAEGFNKFTEKLIISEETSNKLERTFKGVFALLDMGRKLLGAFITPITTILGTGDDITSSFLDMSSSFGDWLVKLNESSDEMNVYALISEKLTKGIEYIIDAITKAINKIEELGDAVKSHVDTDGILKSIDKLKGGMDSINIDTSKIDGFISKIQNSMSGISSIGEFVTSVFNVLGELISALIPAVFQLGGVVAGSLCEALKEVWSALTGDDNLGKNTKNITLAVVLYNLKKVFIQINKLIGTANPIKGIKNFVGQLTDTLYGLENSLNADFFIKLAGAILILAFAMSVLAGIDSNKLAESVGVVIGLMAALTKCLERFTKYNKLLNSDMSSAKGPFGLIENLINKFSKTSVISTLAGAFIAMASAVGILVLALKVLSDIEPDRLLPAMLAIETLLFSLTMSMKMLSSFGDKKMTKGIGSVILFAFAIRVLAKATEVLSEIEPDRLWDSVGAIIVLMGVMTAVIKVLSKSTLFKEKGAYKQVQNNMISAGLGMIAIAAAMKIMASVCKDFSTLNPEQIITSLIMVGSMLGALTAVEKVLSGSKGLVKAGIGMILIATALKIVAKACSEFSDVDDATLERAGIALGGLSFVLYELTKRLEAKDLIATSAALVVAGIALKIIANDISKFTEIDDASVFRAAGAIVVLASILGVLSKATKAKDLVATSAALIIFGIALNILTPALKGLGSMSLGSIAKSLVMLGGALTIFVVAVYALKPVAGVLLKICAAVALFGAGIALLGVGITLISASAAALGGALYVIVVAVVESLKVLIVGIAELIPQIGAVIAELIGVIIESLAVNGPELMNAVFSLIGNFCDQIIQYAPKIAQAIVALLDAVLGEVIRQMSDILANKDIVGSFTELLLGIAGSVGILATVTKLCGKGNLMMGVLAFAAVLAALVAALYIITEFDLTGAIVACKDLGILALELSASLVVLSGVGALAEFAIAGILAFDIFLADLVAVLAVLGGLSKIPGFNDIIAAGGGVLGLIGDAIGTFIGSIISGFATAATANLSEIATQLSTFMMLLTPFIVGLKMIDVGVLESAGILAGIITLMTAADLLTGLASFVTGSSSFVTLGQELAQFGLYLTEFAIETSQIDLEKLMGAITALSLIIAACGNIPNEGGFVSLFTGDNKLSDFGAELADAGPHIKDFADSVKGMDATGAIEASKAIKAIAEVADAIPNEGGLVSLFAGDNSIGKFAEELVPFGENLVTFSEKVDGKISESGIASAVSAAGKLVELDSSLSDHGGFFGAFTGDYSLSSFGRDLGHLGEGLKNFSDEVADINVLKMGSATAAASKIVELDNMLSEHGGIFSAFTGDYTIGDFATDLTSLGTGMKNYASEVSEINVSKVNASSSALNAIAQIDSLLGDHGGVGSWFTGDYTVSDFGDDLVGLGSGLASFISSIGDDIKADKIDLIGKLGPKLTELANGITSNAHGQGFLDLFTGNYKFGDLKQNLSLFCEAIVEFSKDCKNGLSDANIDALNSASTTITNMFNGFKAAAESINTGDMATVSKVLNNSGQYLATSVTDGVSSEDAQASAVKAIKTLTRVMSETLSKEWKGFTSKAIKLATTTGNALANDSALINRFLEAGKHYISGLINGLKDATKRAELTKAAGELGDSVDKTVRRHLIIKSPSRLAKETGGYYTQGLALGILSLKDRVSDASGEVSDLATDTITTALQAIDDIASSSDDLSPVIRPVFDASGIESGMSAMRSLFGQEYALSAYGNVSDISRHMNSNQNGATNDDVVHSINKLSKQLSGIKANNYTVNGITYDNGSEVSNAVESLIRAARIERRI